MRDVRKRDWKRDFETLEWNEAATGWALYVAFLVASIACTIAVLR
jgi:hypothetical protein